MSSNTATLPVRKGYKVTEVGVIPEEWNFKTISDIADVKGGKRLPKGEELTDIPTDHPYIRVSDMRMGGIDSSDIKYVPEHIWPAIQRYTISRSDLFISVAGTLGIVGEVPESLDGANLTENADKICNIGCSKSFLLYLLQSELIRKIISNARTVCAQPKLAIEQIKSFPVPLPPLPEQEKIAEILSTVDEHIGETEDLIEKTETLKRGMMQKLLTRGIGHTEFKDTEIGRIPEKWDIVSFGDICACQNRKYNPNPNETKKYVALEHLEQNTAQLLGWSNSSKSSSLKTVFHKNDILFGKLRPYLRKYWLARFDGVCSTEILVFKATNKVLPAIVLYMVELDSFIEKATGQSYGTKMPRASWRDIKNIHVPLLPLPEQRKIADILTTIDDRIEEHQAKLEALNRLKTGLMQQLLTGKIRVRI